MHIDVHFARNQAQQFSFVEWLVEANMIIIDVRTEKWPQSDYGVPKKPTATRG